MDPIDNPYIANECTRPGCNAQPGEPCIWTGEPTEKSPEPKGSPRAPHASRKYRIWDPEQEI